MRFANKMRIRGERNHVENSTSRSPQLVFLAVIMGLSLIICTVIFSGAFVKARSTSALTVTGAAERELRSDLVVWRGNFTRRSPQLPEAYALLKSDLEEIKSHLKAQGVLDEEITFMPVSMNTFYEVDKHGRETSEIRGYGLWQSVEVRSTDVDRITAVSRTSGELISKGIEFNSEPPQYFYTKLNDIKVEMLAEATKNARQRAEQIAVQGGGRLGPLRSAKMGVFQITPVHSTEVSDYGVNDTWSLEKKITAVVNAEFAIN
ncbi:protein of unknown function DUF541 [Candidatus Desulforudis audaxviator MP104C]|uniref:SIMPL domain-containing protein n=1 Tax=Desulforudis audaxviator (strain MP104C) TaxID=477974 RepID=B1I639_DESAP|nr:protein of unknown function DUF541 [Candidatus Desulforudis audaxviator MP104C]